MKRAPLRMILIIVLILATVMAVAYAAGNIFGWNDFFANHYKGTQVPELALEQMRAIETQEITVGNIVFSVQELFCDGRTGMSTVEARTADGSKAVLCMEYAAPLNAIGENGDAYAALLGVDSSVSCLEAARALGVPLYEVRAILQVVPEQFAGEWMEEALWDAEGNMAYFSLIDRMNPDALGDALHAKLFLRVAEFDPETAEELSHEKVETAVDIPVSPVLAQQHYTPEDTLRVNGLVLKETNAVQTAAGAYLETVFIAEDGVDRNDFYYLPECGYLNADGQFYDIGMNLSVFQDSSSWPQASMTFLIAVDTLPEELVFRMGEEQVVLR